MRRLAVVGVAAAAMLGGCGQERAARPNESRPSERAPVDEARAAVAAAADATLVAGSARVRMRTRFEARHEGQTLSHTSDTDGSVDFGGRLARLTVKDTIRGWPTPDGRASFGGTDEIRHIGAIAYTRELEPGAPDEELPWQKRTLGEPQQHEVVWPAPGPGESPAVGRDPALVLGLARQASDVRVEGRQVLDGVGTTRYRARFDKAALTRVFCETTAPPDGASADLDMQIWLDDEQRVRRVSYEVHLDGALDPGGSSRFTSITDYADFGTRVEVAAPPASQVEDVDDPELPEPTPTPSCPARR